MRIPKFKAWHKEFKRMSNVIYLDLLYKVVQMSSEDAYGWYADFEKVELLESTGVLDINGVEIFEGDVFKIPDVYKHLDDFIGKVFWEDGAFCVSYRRSEYGRSEYFLADSLNEELEVIGNIYQNPELVESEADE